MKSFDIEKLIEPYEETKNDDPKSKRSLTSMATKLVNGHKIDPKIVGAAMLIVFNEMNYNGLEFEGNGKKGSKGQELFCCIKAQAIDMVQKKSVEDVINAMNEISACSRLDCKYRVKGLKPESKVTKVKRWLGLRRNHIVWIFPLLPMAGIFLWAYI